MKIDEFKFKDDNGKEFAHVTYASGFVLEDIYEQEWLDTLTHAQKVSLVNYHITGHFLPEDREDK